MTTVESRSMASRIGRGLGWSTASNLVLRAGSFLVSLIMARLIAPAEFGVFAVALTVSTILGTLAEFGLGTDLVRAKDLGRRIPTVATLGLMTSGSLALLMATSAGAVAAAFSRPEATGIIRLMSLSLFIFGFSIVPSALLQREFRQSTMFAINGAALVVQAGTMTTLALLSFGPAALAWGQIASQAVAVAAQYRATRFRLRLGFDREIAKESAGFCIPLAVANLLSWTLLSVDNLVVARLMSPESLGLYVLAFNVSSLPMGAVGTSLRVVALPGFAQVGSATARNRALERISGPVWAISVMLGALLSMLAVPLIAMLYGERWQGAATALVGLACFGATRIVFDLLATFLIAAGATRAVLGVQVAWLVAMVPAMVVGVSRFGLAGAGWAHVAISFAVVLPAYLWCLHRQGVRWRSFLAPWVLPTLAVLPATALCWYLGHHDHSTWSALLLGGCAMVLLYVAPLARWWLRQIRLIQGGELVIIDEGESVTCNE